MLTCVTNSSSNLVFLRAACRDNDASVTNEKGSRLNLLYLFLLKFLSMPINCVTSTRYDSQFDTKLDTKFLMLSLCHTLCACL